MGKRREHQGFRFHAGLAPLLSLLLVCTLGMISGPARAMDECQDGPKADAARNEVSRRSLAWAPFGRPEIGWDVYEPLIAQEIGAACPAASPGFAAAVARWRGAHGLARTGEMDVATLTALLRTLQARRPFVALSRRACPDPPPQTALAAARVTEVYEGKPILLASDALQAYRAMLAAARAESPEIAADRRLLTIFSGFRSPAYDAARCLRDKNCFGITRAACSAHRTGLALDLYLGAAPGSAMDSSDDVNRDYLAHGGAYRWMVKNAARFGFVNYPFEPWHWEWTGGTKAPSQ